MVWIRTVPPEQATGELQEIYQAVRAARGGVAEVHQVQSLNPRALRAHLELYKAVVFARSSLSRVARERVAVVVSAANRCAYCVAHHGEALRRLGDDAALVDRLGRGELPAGLPPADQVLLRWAQRASLSPSSCTRAEVEELRLQGFDDRAILDAALTVAYFCFVNRLVLTLGGEVEPDYTRTCGDTAEDGGRGSSLT